MAEVTTYVTERTISIIRCKYFCRQKNKNIIQGTSSSGISELYATYEWAETIPYSTLWFNSSYNYLRIMMTSRELIKIKQGIVMYIVNCFGPFFTHPTGANQGIL